MKHLGPELIAKPGKKFRIADVDPGDTHGVNRETAEKRLAAYREEMLELQNLLYAEAKRSVLVVLQGLDASGKDGTIRHVMSGLNPQGVTVTSFKVPDGEEKRHDYLWRVHKAVPEFGKIGIFNRSHYEDVLVVRVHELVSKEVWSKRYEQINDFEQMLAENGVRILKFLLWISKEEQGKRFAERLSNSAKNWKFSAADTKERGFWKDYEKAYDDVVRRCSTKWAPWYIVPADCKWFRNVVVSQIVRDELRSMKMRYPKGVAG